VTGWIAAWLLSRVLSEPKRWRGLLALPVLLLVGLVLLVAVLVGGMGTSEASCGTPTPVSAPSGDPQTMKADGQYLKSQGFTPFAAAGVVGNLQQENGLSPSGDGLAQWGGGWKTKMQTWITQHGGDPATTAWQLAYIVASARDPSGAGFGFPYAGIWADLTKAQSPEDAAMYWQNDYEKCDGVTPADFGTPNANDGLCNSPSRKSYAAQAFQALGGSSSAVNVSYTVSGTCVSASYPSVGGYVNPFAHTIGLSPERIDMGVDYAGTGEIDAIGDAKIIAAATGGTGWTSPMNTQACVYYQLLGGAYVGKYVYVCEDIVPTVNAGQVVRAGQAIAVFIPTSSTGLETGWGTGTPYGALATTTGGYHEGEVTAAGASFSRLLKSLGVPVDPATAAITPTGSVPAGYP